MVVQIIVFFLRWNRNNSSKCLRVFIFYSKASLNLKRALWGDKPSGLLPEN
jgi:hypothetical protein